MKWNQQPMSDEAIAEHYEWCKTHGHIRGVDLEAHKQYIRVCETDLSMTALKVNYPPCPRCGGPVPAEGREGQYPGALSRTTRGDDDVPVEVCSECGMSEALEEWVGTLTPQSAWPV